MTCRYVMPFARSCKIVLENRERGLRKRITVRVRSGATTWKTVKLR